MAKLLGNNKLYVESPKKVAFINDLEIGGVKPRAKVGKAEKNSTVYFDAEELVVNNATLTNDLECYNVFEQVYGAKTVKKVLKKVTVVGLTLNAKSTNNIFSMYNFADGANIVFKNCNFMLCDGSNALRVDNLQDAKNVLITFEDCVWNFQSTTAYGKDWDALIIFQDSAHLDAPHFADWKLVVKNCKFGENPITPESFKNYADFVITNEESKNGKALLYMYTATKSGDTWWKPTENPELFPVVKIIAGNASKEFKA